MPREMKDALEISFLEATCHQYHFTDEKISDFVLVLANLHVEYLFVGIYHPQES